MRIEHMKMHLMTLKLYMERIEEFVKHAETMIFEIEKKMMDMEYVDELGCQEYNLNNKIQKLNEAATQLDSPARLRMNRCVRENTDGASFIQDFSKFDIIKTKRS